MDPRRTGRPGRVGMDERRAIERIKQGDIGGLEALVRAHQLRAGRAAYLICRERALAEDVVQGAFMRVTLTLERVTNSPGGPQGVFCFDPPDNEHDWFPTGGDLAFEGGPVAGKGHCLEMLLNVPLQGSSSVTVAEIEGIPPCASGNDEVCAGQERTIRAPWTFDFEVPDP